MRYEDIRPKDEILILELYCHKANHWVRERMKRRTFMCVAIQRGRLHELNFQLLEMISIYSTEMEIIPKSFWKTLKKSFKIKSRSCNQPGVILPSLAQRGQQEGMLNSLPAMLPFSSLMKRFYRSVCPPEVYALHFPW